MGKDRRLKTPHWAPLWDPYLSPLWDPYLSPLWDPYRSPLWGPYLRCQLQGAVNWTDPLGAPSTNLVLSLRLRLSLRSYPSARLRSTRPRPQLLEEK